MTKPLNSRRRPSSLIRWLRGLTYRLAHKETLCTIPVAILLPDADDTATCYPKIEAALRLIRDHDPRRFRHVQRYVRAIILSEHPMNFAQWLDDVRMCELARPYVIAPSTTPTHLAGTIVHETTHARLFRLGIDYHESRRARVEAVCYNAELDFGSRMPDGAEVVQHAERALARDPSYYAASTFRQDNFEALRRLGCPEWLVRTVEWVTRRRAA